MQHCFKSRFTSARQSVFCRPQHTQTPGSGHADGDENDFVRASDMELTSQGLVLSYVYDFPVEHSKKYLRHRFATTVLGGWEMSGISVFQGGRLVLVTAPD
jgi:hypothetical protein